MIQVRTAQREDSAGIAAVHVRSWQSAYLGLLPPRYLESLSITEREQSWAGILDGSASTTFVASAGETVLGFVSFGHCRDQGADQNQGEIWALYVDPDHWSTGIGWALWEAARVRMVHRGFSELSLWVLSENARGRRFYAAVGFVPDPGLEQSFERGGVRLREVRLRFGRMSACPSIERTA